MDKIILCGLEFWGRHGVYAEEKEKPQQFSVDLEIAIDLKVAALKDDLTLTLDYQDLYQRIKNEVESSSYDLIETLAEKIATLVLEDPKAKDVKVRLKKCRAKSGEDVFTAGVEIERGR